MNTLTKLLGLPDLNTVKADINAQADAVSQAATQAFYVIASELLVVIFVLLAMLFWNIKRG